MALQAGTPLAPYVILDPLGAGGMGEVYRARDPRLDRDVALKVLPENVARDPARLRRFEQEAKAVAALNHPAILAVFDVGAEGEIPFLVSELLEGRTLREVLSAGPMPLPEALDVACHVSTGLAAAHEKGIVHRDLKPENLFLTTDGRIKILDFGLARRHGPLPPPDVDPDGSTAAGTRPGAVLGTVGYMSPEQVRGEVVDERTDVFSFGCVLYEMLTGLRAFSERSAAETMAAILREDPLQRPSGRPVLPPSLERLLRRCLEKTPERRFRSAHELTLALEVLSGPGSAREAVFRDLGDSGRRWRWPWARAAGAFPNPPAAGALRPLPVAGLVVLGVMVLWWRGPALLRPIPPAAAPVERLVVAVAPFAGPDEDSVKEGRVMGALVEKAIAQRLSPNGVTVLGIDQTAQPAADHAAARALAEKLGADIVVWGEVLAIRGETEIQPYFTLASRRSPARAPAADRFGADALAAVGERVGEALVVGAGMPSQIEARKTSATGIGNLVLTLVGVHALYAEGRPEKALALFAQAPRNSETLRYRAEALAALRRTEEARKALDEALALSPGDAQTWATLGDLHLEARRYTDATAAYSRAAESGATFSTRQGILFDGKLYLRERFAAASGEAQDSGYLLAIDPADGKVFERHLLPGVASALKVASGVLEVTCEDPAWKGGVGTDVVQVAHGKALEPVLLSSSLGLRRAALSNGEALAAGPGGFGSALRSTWPSSQARPRLAELESTLRAARDRDPTQPWHRFFLGQALWPQERHAEAEREWEALLASGAFPATPYYEYAHMAARFERLGLRTWADRAYVEALNRRRRMPQPIGSVVRFERFFNTPWVTTRGALGSPDPERERLWLVRAREFGLSTEGEDVAAALWEGRLRRQGRTAEAEQEAQIRRRAQHDALNVVQMAGRTDYALQVYVALGAAALIAGLALLAAASRRRRSRANDSLRLATVCFIWPAERRVLVLAAGLAALAAGVFLSSIHVVSRIAYVPIGLGDSLGSAGVRAELERLVEGAGTDEARFALAVSNHLAGRVDRARALYESLPANPRARRNLAALRSGSLAPPEPVGSDDLRGAFASVSWRALPRAVSDAGELLASFLLIWSSSKEIIIAVLFGGLVPLSAGVLLLLVLAWSPVPEPEGAESLPRPTVRRLVFVPGLADLCGGAPVRGYLALATGVLCIVAIVSKVSYAARHAIGPMSADALVWSAGIPGLSEAPLWADLWIYRDAPLWWLLVLLSFALSVGLHLRGLALRRLKAGREVAGAPPAAGIDSRTH